MSIKELMKDPRNSRATNAILEVIELKSNPIEEEIFQHAYKLYSTGKHRRPSEIRYEVRKSLIWLKLKGYL